MPQTIRMTVEGKTYNVKWGGSTPPTMADIEDIEATIRGKKAPADKDEAKRMALAATGMRRPAYGPPSPDQFDTTQLMTQLESAESRGDRKEAMRIRKSLEQVAQARSVAGMTRMKADKTPAATAQNRAAAHQNLLAGWLSEVHPATLTAQVAELFGAPQDTARKVQTGVQVGAFGPATQMVAGVLNLPVEIREDLGVLMHPNATGRDKAGAAVNTLLNLGFDGVAIGGILSGAKLLPKWVKGASKTSGLPEFEIARSVNTVQKQVQIDPTIDANLEAAIAARTRPPAGAKPGWASQKTPAKKPRAAKGSTATPKAETPEPAATAGPSTKTPGPGVDVDVAINQVRTARSARYEIDFESERRGFPQDGAPGGFHVDTKTGTTRPLGSRGKPKPYEHLEIAHYDESGKLDGTFSVVVKGEGEGAYKITVRPDVQKKGVGKALLAEAERQGYDVAANAGRNAYSPSGRALAESYLRSKSPKPTPTAGPSIKVSQESPISQTGKGAETGKLDSLISNIEKQKAQTKRRGGKKSGAEELSVEVVLAGLRATRAGLKAGKTAAQVISELPYDAATKQALLHTVNDAMRVPRETLPPTAPPPQFEIPGAPESGVPPPPTFDAGGPPITPQGGPPSLTPGGPSVSAALKNAFTDFLRAHVNLPGLQSVGRETMEAWGNRAVSEGIPDRAINIAQDILDGKKTHLTEVEGSGFAIRMAQLRSQYDGLEQMLRPVLGTDAEDPILAAMHGITDEIDKLTEAGRKVGTAQARAFTARKAFFKDDTSFEGIYAQKRKAHGRKLTDNEVREVKRQADDFKRNADEAEAVRQAQGKGTARDFVENLKRQRRNVKRADAQTRRTDAVERLKTKWVNIQRNMAGMQAEDPTGMMAVARAAAQYKEIVPEITEIAKALFDEGIVVADELISQLGKIVRGAGVQATDQELGAILGRQVPDATINPRTEWEGLRDSLQDDFNRARVQIKKALDELKQLESEAILDARDARRFSREQRFPRTTKTQKEIREDMARWRQREAELKRYETEFWKEMDWWQKSWEMGERAKSPKNFESALTSRLAKGAGAKEYTNWWKSSEAGRQTQLMNQIDRLHEKLRVARDEGIILGEKERLKLPGNEELRRLEIEREGLKMELEDEMNWIRAQREPETLFDAIGKNAGIFRTLKSGLLDVGAMLLQGGWTFISQPSSWFKATKNFPRFFREADFKDYIASVRAEPDYAKIRVTGVDLPGLTSHPGEEMFLSKALENIPIAGPGIAKPSRQHYDGWLTGNRVAVVRKAIDDMEAMGKDFKPGIMGSRHGGPLSPEVLKFAGHYTNATTGRGMNPFMKALSNEKGFGNPLFAPRWWSSLFETAVPIRMLSYAKKIAKTEGDYRPLKFLAKQYSKAFIGASTLTAGGIMAADQLSDWDFVGDTRDSDFGRMRTFRVDRNGVRKQVTVDILPEHIRQPLGFIMRSIQGRRDAEGKESDPNVWIEFGFTAGGKTAPLYKTAEGMNSARFGKKTYGESFDYQTWDGIKNIMRSLGEPISVGNIRETLWDNDILTPTEKVFLTIGALVGRGGNIRELE